MNSKFRRADTRLSLHQIDIDDLLAANRLGAVETPAALGRRARRRAARRNLANAGLVASLLAAEGCKTLGDKELPMGGGGQRPGGNGGGNNNGGDFTPVDDHFNAEAGQPLEIPASQLLANDIHDESNPLEIVRVFGAVNGTVSFDGSVVTFVPNEGFEGTASFSYEARDSSGATHSADVFIDFSEGAVPPGEDGGGPDGSADASHPHPDDPSKAEEHIALMNLVPVEEATHVAVNNGSWFDPATWANGEVPGDGARVYIPEGVDVVYDGESPVSLFTVRVDGTLEFATDQNTFMEVDTLVVAPSGHLIIGTIANPVAANVSAIIQIADNGPIDVAWDPMLLSRGVISHGEVEIHGAEKDTFLKVAVDPMAGDTSITLEAPPEGWHVGDRLVLTGTHLAALPPATVGETRDVETEDEELIITAIEGNVIHFDRPLQFDHDAPRDDLKAYVANYSRNVQILTENADDVPVYQRGHVMLMHSDDIDIRYAEFYELGRTDKSERAFDVADLDSVSYDTNIKARYSLHIHRAGVDDIDHPAMLVGNAVWGSPGWGFVQHDSNAILADNAAYDVFGAAFVSETGNEIGRWVHNIAIKSIGVKGLGDLNNPKTADDVDAFDLGRTGAGFWFESRLVDAVDNVAAGVPSGQAFVYFHRGGPDDVIKVLADTAPYPEALQYFDSTYINKPSISMFSGNEAIASGTGLMVVKSTPTQHHDIRSVIEDFTAWNVNYGVHLEYTAHYTIIDLDAIGAPGSAAGISYGPSAVDLVVNGADISGFETGVFASKHSTLSADFDGDFQYVFIDVNITGAVQNYQNISEALNDVFLTGADLVDGRLSFTSDYEGNIPTLVRNQDNPSIELSGVKVDSIGSVQISAAWDPHLYYWSSLENAIEREGYWTLPDGRLATVFDQYIADRATGELHKVATVVAFEDVNRPNLADILADAGYVYHGLLDLDNAAPVANDDSFTVSANGSIVIDVLANDFDPDGDPIAIDGVVYPDHGSLYKNEDGTLTYVPDPNYTGTDYLWYWVEDDNGNFSKAHVHMTIEA